MKRFLDAILLQIGAVFGYGWALIRANIIKPILRKDDPAIEEMPQKEDTNSNQR